MAESEKDGNGATGALDAALAALDGADRARRLAVVFQIGEALAGGNAADPDVARAVVRLETLAADRECGHWLRKRAKRALRKIRGEPET